MRKNISRLVIGAIVGVVHGKVISAVPKTWLIRRAAKTSIVGGTDQVVRRSG